MKFEVFDSIISSFAALFLVDRIHGKYCTRRLYLNQCSTTRCTPTLKHRLVRGLSFRWSPMLNV